MRVLAAIISFSLAIFRAGAAVDYNTVAKNYSAQEAPDGFLEFSKKHGVDTPNTCAVRLSYALFKADDSFFKEVKA